MWSSCHPKSDDDLKECAELGKSLNRLSQPTILTLLAQSETPLHGYIIVQQAASSPMFGGKKPDATGVYRALKRMEESGLVTSEWETPAEDQQNACSNLRKRAIAACVAGSTHSPATSSHSKSFARTPPTRSASIFPTHRPVRTSSRTRFAHGGEPRLRELCNRYLSPGKGAS